MVVRVEAARFDYTVQIVILLLMVGDNGTCSKQRFTVCQCVDYLGQGGQ